jgi:hypothetical protein
MLKNTGLVVKKMKLISMVDAYLQISFFFDKDFYGDIPFKILIIFKINQ